MGLKLKEPFQFLLEKWTDLQFPSELVSTKKEHCWPRSFWGAYFLFLNPSVPSLPLVWLLSEPSQSMRPGPVMSSSFSSGLFFWSVSLGSNRHKGSIRVDPGGTAASALLLLISGHLWSSDSLTRARRCGVQGRGPLAWGACCVPAPLGASAWK